MRILKFQRLRTLFGWWYCLDTCTCFDGAIWMKRNYIAGDIASPTINLDRLEQALSSDGVNLNWMSIGILVEKDKERKKLLWSVLNRFEPFWTVLNRSEPFRTVPGHWKQRKLMARPRNDRTKGQHSLWQTIEIANKFVWSTCPLEYACKPPTGTFEYAGIRHHKARQQTKQACNTITCAMCIYQIISKMFQKCRYIHIMHIYMSSAITLTFTKFYAALQANDICIL